MGFLTIRPNFKSGDVIPQTFKTSRRYGSIEYKKDAKFTDVANVNDALTVKLKVMDSISIDREVTISKTKVHKSGWFAPYVFNDDGDGYYSFEVRVVITNSWDYYNLDYIFRNRVPVNVVIDTYAIPNSMYLITDASQREVIRKNVWEWTVKFTTYFDVEITRKTTDVKQKKVDDLTKKVSKCTLKKWQKKDKNKKDINDCNQIITKILYKKGFLKKKYVGKNWNVHYVAKLKTGTSNISNPKNVVKSVKAGTKVNVYPCRIALKKFQKKWNRKKLKPHLKENGKKDKNTLKALKRYKEL